MLSRLAFLCTTFVVAAAATGCPGSDPEPGNDTGSSPTSSASGTQTSGDTTAGSTGAGVDCDDATDEASCAAAANLAEGGGCTWMVIYDVTVDAGGTCGFTDSGTGTCTGTDGVDDGCNEGQVCSDNREVYFRAAGDGWQMAQGRACRGVSGFDQCTDEAEEPCTCACDLP